MVRASCLRMRKGNGGAEGTQNDTMPRTERGSYRMRILFVSLFAALFASHAWAEGRYQVATSDKPSISWIVDAETGQVRACLLVDEPLGITCTTWDGIDYRSEAERLRVLLAAAEAGRSETTRDAERLAAQLAASGRALAAEQATSAESARRVALLSQQAAELQAVLDATAERDLAKQVLDLRLESESLKALLAAAEASRSETASSLAAARVSYQATNAMKPLAVRSCRSWRSTDPTSLNTV